jgi:hypothetical protein
MRKPTFIIASIFLMMMLMAAVYARPIYAAYKEAPIAEKNEIKYTLKFHNLSDETVVFHLYHMDHGLNFDGDMDVACGELEPGKRWSFKKQKGEYYVIWEKLHDAVLLKMTIVFIIAEDMDFYYP